MPRLHQDVMRVLIADIVTGQRAAGEKLPREADVALQFGVSRGVARECLRAMEERGLITVRHGRGSTVRGADAWDVFDPDVLAALLDSDRAPMVLSQYVECRRILELEAAGLAARRARPEDLEAMADALTRMEASTRRRPSRAAEGLFHEADLAFHAALIAATGNRALGVLVARIHGGLLAARYPLARPQYRTERALPEHRRILTAIARGDADEARAAMAAHLDTIAGYLGELRAGDRRSDGED
jgi:GntR family transcriptional repressor for pyruvate dehydrogenase complex